MTDISAELTSGVCGRATASTNRAPPTSLIGVPPASSSTLVDVDRYSSQSNRENRKRSRTDHPLDEVKEDGARSHHRPRQGRHDSSFLEESEEEYNRWMLNFLHGTQENEEKKGEDPQPDLTEKTSSEAAAATRTINGRSNDMRTKNDAITTSTISTRTTTTVGAASCSVVDASSSVGAMMVMRATTDQATAPIITKGRPPQAEKTTNTSWMESITTISPAVPPSSPSSREKATGPSQKHYEQEGKKKQLLMCMVIGLRDWNGGLVDGTDFRREPYETYYQRMRAAKGEKRKAHEPTGSALEEEINRRLDLAQTTNKRRPGRARCKDDAVQWLTNHPITDPSDIAYFINEISNYRNFIENTFEQDHHDHGSSSPPPSSWPKATPASIKKDRSFLSSSLATREEMERRLRELDMALVSPSVSRQWSRQLVISKVKMLEVLEQLGDDGKLQMVELEVAKYAKALEEHTNTERRLLDEKRRIQKKLASLSPSSKPKT